MYGFAGFVKRQLIRAERVNQHGDKNKTVRGWRSALKNRVRCREYVITLSESLLDKHWIIRSIVKRNMWKEKWWMRRQFPWWWLKLKAWNTAVLFFELNISESLHLNEQVFLIWQNWCDLKCYFKKNKHKVIQLIHQTGDAFIPFWNYSHVFLFSAF